MTSTFSSKIFGAKAAYSRRSEVRQPSVGVNKRPPKKINMFEQLVRTGHALIWVVELGHKKINATTLEVDNDATVFLVSNAFKF
jgi:hypothetical protein